MPIFKGWSAVTGGGTAIAVHDGIEKTVSNTSPKPTPLVDELEKGIAGASQNAQKAAYHLQLGRVLETKFLSGVKALKHFQDACKMNPALLESLEAARMIYWDLGKLNMVQKLLELELKAVQGPEATVLLLELGDVMCDLGDYDKATATYARSLAASGGANKDASSSRSENSATAVKASAAP